MEPTLLIKWDDSMMDKVTAMTKRYDELNEEVRRRLDLRPSNTAQNVPALFAASGSRRN